MIKQIQLRGISRTPSDRATADGGCAESLNVHMAENELSPTLPAEDATEGLGLPPYGNREYIYIHKGNGYTNYITLDGMEIGAYVDGIYESISYMEQGETLQSVTSIGNTLIVMGDKHPYYAIFKDGHYVFLGSTIPLPTIKIWPEPVRPEDMDFTDDAEALQRLSWRTFYKVGNDDSELDPVDPRPNHYVNYASIYPGTDPMSLEFWNNQARVAEEKGERYAGREILEEDEPDLMTWMKEYAVLAEMVAKKNKYLYHQVMMLYGVRLYNNTYITSVPVLMPGGFESPYCCRFYRHRKNANWNKEAIDFKIRYPYKIKAQLLDFDEHTLKLWSDIIMSIDFFMTPNIPFDISNEKVAYAVREYKSTYSTTNDIFNYYEIRPCSEEYHRHYKDRLLANGSDKLRRAVTLSTDEKNFEDREIIEKLREGDLLDLDEFIVDQDALNSQNALAEFSYNMSNAERVAKNVTSMNNRMLMSGVTETVTSGAPFFPAAPCCLPGINPVNSAILPHPIPYIEESHRYDIAEAPVSYDFYHTSGSAEPTYSLFKSDFNFPQGIKYVQLVYHIQGRDKYIVRGRIGEMGSFVDTFDGTMGYFGFMLFPDTRCTSVDIYMSTNGSTWFVKSYIMQEHPGLPCAYMYEGVEKNLMWDICHIDMRYNNAIPVYTDNGQGQPTADPSLIEEHRTEHKEDTLMLSDMDNPWFVPLENQYQFQATEIIGTALATKALSTGQFGQFPLYVFTDNGIWAMQMNQLGTFSSSHAVSMDVAKRGTILSLDQAVAFVTDKGLLLITGSDIQNLSPNMNGEHYVVNSEYKGEIKGF